MKIRPKILSPIFLLLILGLPTALALIKPGFYEPHDLHHFADIYEMVRAFLSGQMPPRWGPDYLWGYGYPLFNFYYVLPFYLGALFFAIFGSLTLSFKLVFVTSLAASVILMYLFLREFFNKFASFVGATLYLYTPYRAIEVYVRGAIGEALALALLPGVLWLLVRVLKKTGAREIASASLMLALFILSHNYIWLLSAPWILLLVIFISFLQKEKKKIFLAQIVVGLLAAGISAYWWLPALIEQKLVSSVTPFPLIDHFPFFKQLILPSWGYGASVPGPGDGLSFQIGVVNLVVFVVFLTLLVFRKKLFDKTRLAISLWVLGGFLLTVFMMNIRSYPIWRLLPFYNFVQFPWRLLFLTTLFTSVMAAILVELLPVKIAKIAGALVIITSLALTINYFRPSKVVYKTDNDYLARMFANPSWSEDYLLLPSWVKQKPDSVALKKIEVENGMAENIREITLTRWSATVNSPKDTTAIFHSLYFPGWYGKVDGRAVKLAPFGPGGEIQLTIPSGKHELVIYWGETPLRRLTDIISLGSVTLVVFLLLKKRRAEAI